VVAVTGPTKTTLKAHTSLTRNMSLTAVAGQPSASPSPPPPPGTNLPHLIFFDLSFFFLHLIHSRFSLDTTLSIRQLRLKHYDSTFPYYESASLVTTWFANDRLVV
jgi:hypothetical protein